MKEYITNIHIHSVYSDGIKTPPEIARDAAKAGVDIIMITDHNVFTTGFNGYYTFTDRKVLLLTGEEIHDQLRQPQKNHMLALGIEKDFSRHAHDPQELIDAVRKSGGLTFIAHAYDPALPMVGEADLSWVDWDIQGFTGFELWNNLSELKIRAKNIWQLALFALFPQFMALEPPRQIREIWDSYLAKGQKLIAIGGADVHTIPKHFGPFTMNVFPYSYHFRTINNHVFLPDPLSGDTQTASRQVMDAIRAGHSFIGYDLIKPTRGFKFYLADVDATFEMGSSVPFSGRQELKAELPFPAEYALIRNGKTIAQGKMERSRAWKIEQPGVYRLECYRRFLGKKRGWIFSNPIFIDKS
jgi:hypothetical protein